MEHAYRSAYELWGSAGRIRVPRARLRAARRPPPGDPPGAAGQHRRTWCLQPDDQYLAAVRAFSHAVRLYEAACRGRRACSRTVRATGMGRAPSAGPSQSGTRNGPWRWPGWWPRFERRTRPLPALHSTPFRAGRSERGLMNSAVTDKLRCERIAKFRDVIPGDGAAAGLSLPAGDLVRFANGDTYRFAAYWDRLPGGPLLAASSLPPRQDRGDVRDLRRTEGRVLRPLTPASASTPCWWPGTWSPSTRASCTAYMALPAPPRWWRWPRTPTPRATRIPTCCPDPADPAAHTTPHRRRSS
ncbi:hypothetical protein LT493_11905 [Streptomyces tricolor]|nr:hypothetical protein [Streptomyces tricolor]